MRVFIALFAVLAATAGQVPDEVTQIVPSSIESHPAVVALLRSVNFVTTIAACGGSILNNRAVLSAARCFESDGAERWRFRVGSSYWNNSGIIHYATDIIRHDNWDEWAMLTDIAVVRTHNINIGGNVQLGTFAGPNYVVPLGQQVLTTGWGYSLMPVWTHGNYHRLHEFTMTNFNVTVCREIYSSDGLWVAESQLCHGFNNITEVTRSRDKCFGEPGMPVFHNGIIVGVRSYSLSCLTPEVPSVSTRVSNFILWAAGVAES